MSSVELDYKLRVMQVCDLTGVLVNEHRCYDFPWTIGVFSDCVKSGHECWLFEVAGQNTGHAILSVAAGESHLLNVCINPDYQGQGYGRILVEFMLDRAMANGVSSMFLEVRPSNVVAYKLYESLGFNEVGIRKGYYPAAGPREDAIVFAKEFFYD
jgi:ribosomal-protein-alanine N-acetyltransferase